MSVTADFYKIKADSRCLQKDLGSVLASKSITIKDSCSILSPVIVLRYDSTVASCNYVYLGAPFDRYYFMGSPVLSPGKRMAIPCSVDPLMSHQAAILAMKLNVYRQERDKNSSADDYIGDAQMPTIIAPEVFTKRITTNVGDITFDDYSSYVGTRQYVMTVVGGLKNDV